MAPTFSSFNAMPNKSTKEKNIMVSASWFDILLQWNPDITICQGSSGIRSLYRGIVISRLPIERYCRKITENIVISG